MDLSLDIIVILTACSIFGGVLNAISGGAGMIIVPLMLVMGIPPINAIAVNKFQNTLGSTTAAYQYLRKGFLDIESSWPLLIYALVGSCIGVVLLQWFSATGILEVIIPYVLIFIALYIAFAPVASSSAGTPKMSKSRFNAIIGSGAGLYGGFFGMGTGPSLVLAFSVLRGYELRMAVSNSRLVMMVIHTSSTLILMAGGHVWWLIAICMALGNIAGSYLGSHLLIKSGYRLIKALLVIVPLASAIKLLFFD
jgi:uncharacterized membrane protein YfcA